ncbi:MAG TPA: ABC transporter ATP-binding protein [Gemmatimonadales bacterium]|nr:ABC transporter ATP-binding protein [Gemmatimonadales bacterium]
MLWAEGVRHRFGAVPALDDVTFTLPAGHTLALFGPNGAGKTTLLKVLAGLIVPRAGRAGVEGGRGAIGWIGHQSLLYGQLTVRENLRFWGSLYGVRAPVLDARTSGLAARLDLREHLDRRVGTLSRGQTQRAAIARALMHDPKVLLLDEPFTGLDRVATSELANLVREFAGRGEGRATILVTHNVEEGTDLATDIGILKAGRLVELAPRNARSAGQVGARYRELVS